jgi:hypothetical protein
MLRSPGEQPASRVASVMAPSIPKSFANFATATGPSLNYTRATGFRIALKDVYTLSVSASTWRCHKNFDVDFKRNRRAKSRFSKW